MTNKHKKPIPSAPAAHNKICPVCGQPSYSPAGIHPQCATVQADAPRQEQLRAEKQAEAAKKSKQKTTQPWSHSKVCPSCDAKVHVRRKQCECGHKFAQ